LHTRQALQNPAQTARSQLSRTTEADIPYQRWKFEAPITDDKDFYRVKAVPNTDN
jgi:hypothetical protein